MPLAGGSLGLFGPSTVQNNKIQNRKAATEGRQRLFILVFKAADVNSRTDQKRSVRGVSCDFHKVVSVEKMSVGKATGTASGSRERKDSTYQ
jgi:hypothetical protein